MTRKLGIALAILIMIAAGICALAASIGFCVYLALEKLADWLAGDG